MYKILNTKHTWQKEHPDHSIRLSRFSPLALWALVCAPLSPPKLSPWWGHRPRWGSPAARWAWTPNCGPRVTADPGCAVQDSGGSGYTARPAGPSAPYWERGKREKGGERKSEKEGRGGKRGREFGRKNHRRWRGVREKEREAGEKIGLQSLSSFRYGKDNFNYFIQQHSYLMPLEWMANW